MTIRKNITEVVQNDLCTSCGICSGACSKNAIAFVYGKEKNVPKIDTSLCVNCGICYEICPGKGIQLNTISKELFGKEPSIQVNKYVGHYLKSYTGHSTDENIRFHSATGGMVTQFLIYLLKNNIIDGAIVVRYNKDNIFEPEPFIATTEEEIWESRSSKYVITSMDKIANEITHLKKTRLVVVGLPCQIQGWRQLAKKNKRIKETIIGYFAIYCSVNKTKHSLDYYLYRYKINKLQVGRFTFRDDGCMGYMKFTDKEGRDLKKIPYLKFWFGTHSFFVNSRCSLCIDQVGELADISFGDIHIPPFSDDKIGTNSLITRSSYWDNILNNCQKEKVITLEEVPINTLIKSQEYVKKFKKGVGVKTNFKLRKLIGKPNPIYDYCYSGKIGINNFITECSKAIMRIIGRHKKLWIIVKLFDK